MCDMVPRLLVRRPAALLALGGCAWAAGLGAYAATLGVIYREWLGSEVLVVAGWSGLVLCALFPTLYLGVSALVVLVINDRWQGCVVGACCGLALCPVPVGIVNLLWAGGVSNPLRWPPELSLLAVLFATAGAVFSGVAVLRARR